MMKIAEKSICLGYMKVIDKEQPSVTAAKFTKWVNSDPQGE